MSPNSLRILCAIRRETARLASRPEDPVWPRARWPRDYFDALEQVRQYGKCR